MTVSGRKIEDVIADIRSTLQGISFPLEYHPELLGTTTEQQAALQQIITIAVVAVIGILLFLQAAYESWRLAFFTWLALPMTLVGGAVAALLNGGLLTIGSLFGFLTILGISVNNSIVLTSRFHPSAAT